MGKVVVNILLGLVNTWEQMPDSEKTAIVELAEQVGGLLTNHKAKTQAKEQ